jgi:glyoxylase-like metal-dependent hydrolase (beta-lactamase superfamily II)
VSKPGNDTPLGQLVTAGEGQLAAEAITDAIFMVKDISNAYLVTTGDGDLLVNTGFIGNGERNKALFAPLRTGRLKRIVITQAHPDHYGAVPELREPGTEVVVGKGFFETVDYFARLDAFLKRRSGKLWASMTRRSGAAPVPPTITAEIEVADKLAFTQGGKRFEVIKVPGGESLDSVIVWLPDEKTVFTGNLFGPVWKSLPNLTTTRGDKPRLVRPYLRSVEMVRDLDPELVVTGHGEPIRGAAAIREDLDRMHGAVSYIERETLVGMNAGKDVHTLMREIVLPDALKVGEFHGNTRWTVRAIWEENAGWIKYEEGTTGLYGVPRSAVDHDLAELAGGAAPLAVRARRYVEQGKPLEALHLLDVALAFEPTSKQALGVKKTALEHLQTAGGGTNLSETMWLKAEIAETDKQLAENESQ